MDDRQRLLELTTSIQRDLVPSLVRMHDEDDLRVLHSAVLHVLDRGQAPTIKELATVIQRSVSRTSRITDQLVRRGLVARQEDSDDRRARRLTLTAEGKALLGRLQAVRVEAQMQLWQHLTVQEREALMQGMEMYARAARRIRDERDPTE